MSRTQNTKKQFFLLVAFLLNLTISLSQRSYTFKSFPVRQTLRNNILINEIRDVQFYQKLKYANLVEQNSILIPYYRVIRTWSLCLYFFNCWFLLDAVREKYSYHSHATLHFICVWPRTFSTISLWFEHIGNSLICCTIQHETHKICLWLELVRRFVYCQPSCIIH